MTAGRMVPGPHVSRLRKGVPSAREPCGHDPAQHAAGSTGPSTGDVPAVLTRVCSLGIIVAAAFRKVGMNPYGVLAIVVLAVHLAFILWIVFGGLVSRNRPVLRWLHLASLAWGVLIEVAPWPCPLTILENHLESLAGVAPYRGPFLVHYLDALVYPDIPESALIAGAMAVCGANLYLHFRRLRRRAL